MAIAVTINKVEGYTGPSIDLSLVGGDMSGGGSGGPETDPIYTADKPNLATNQSVDQKISQVLVDQMTEEQVESIVEQAIQTAQISGQIATETWVDNQIEQATIEHRSESDAKYALKGDSYTKSESDIKYATNEAIAECPTFTQVNVAITTAIEDKQDKLIAGENITISGNTISATGGSSSNVTYSGGELTVNGVKVTTLNLTDIYPSDLVESETIIATYLIDEEGAAYAKESYVDEKIADIPIINPNEYVKKTDIVVDSTPTQNSTNFVTSGGVYLKDADQDAVVNKHRNTDVFRWSDTYEEQLISIIRDATSQGLKTDSIFSPALYPYTVNSEYGGIFRFILHNINDDSENIYSINGVEVYNTAGLPSGPNIEKYRWVNDGDEIEVIQGIGGLASFAEFMPDTESPFYKMVQQVTLNQQMIGSLQNNMLDLKASIDNKVLDPDPNHIEDIVNTSYTVTNSLGGRLNGIGYVLLGLLGVKLVATGTVDVTYTNGTTIREYDNTALVGAGEANPFVLDVDAGTIIVSSGMAGLTFTPYVPK